MKKEAYDVISVLFVREQCFCRGQTNSASIGLTLEKKQKIEEYFNDVTRKGTIDEKL